MITAQKDNFRRLLPYLSTATFTFAGLALVTGVMLSSHFVPTTEAYNATQTITNQVPFGWLVRGLHWWGSSLAIISSILFTSLAYWFGAYDLKSRWLWWSGLLVGLMLLGANVTGYYLPLDQNAYWRLTIESQLFGGLPVLGPIIKSVLLAGSEFSPASVLRINWLHTLIVPVMVVVSLASHFVALKNYDVK
jgi:quinol-cytochrome oxidoreductase complex cytochrome b subunit